MIYSWDFIYIRVFLLFFFRRKPFTVATKRQSVDFLHFSIDFTYIFSTMSMCGGAKVYNKRSSSCVGDGLFL